MQGFRFTSFVSVQFKTKNIATTTTTITASYKGIFMFL